MVRKVKLVSGWTVDLIWVYQDGVRTLKMRCPLCGKEQYMDDDQAYGRVSVQCATTDCTFHVTENFWALYEAS